ncbi:MAG: hypothetical protein ABR538_15635, partial [Candidatus Binatia bacterium]
MKTRCVPVAVVVSFLLFAAIPLVQAQVTPAAKCESGKLKEAGKYGACRLQAESKSVKTGDPADYSKCETKFSAKWQVVEDKAEGACPTDGDLAFTNGLITDHADLLALLLSGGGGSEDPDAVYVSSGSGVDDIDCGALAGPCASIGQGIARAVVDGKLRVYVAALSYFEDVALSDGIDLLGGYDADTWEPSSNPSVLYGLGGSGHRAALSAVGITSATSVSRFVIHGASATTSGANSYAVYVSNSGAGLSISDNVIYAGAAAPGSPASPASDGNQGVTGEGRDSNPAGYDAFITSGAGFCNVANDRQLSNGGVRVCGATNVSGGNGGGNSCPPSSTLTEQSGDDGLTATGAGGGGGGDAGDDSRLESGGALCTTPAAPATGATGSDGTDGISGGAGGGCSSVAGLVGGGHWIASGGLVGSAGTNGRGGGGGGAGGGAYCLSCAENKDRLGGHGGGGGSGGCGGSAGSGGGGGGGSFGLFVSGGAAPDFTGNTVVRGIGGAGGAGARSGSGGSGGDGGEGGDGLICADAGGQGGSGGDGGHGGGGGGGCGGPAYGV